MTPDPRHVRAVSGALSEVERMWKGLPSQVAMRIHLDALQKVLSNMLDDRPKVEPPDEPTPDESRAIADPFGPEPDDPLDQAINRLGRPDALIVQQLREVADEPLGHWLKVSRVSVARRLARLGYDKIPNPRSNVGGWTVKNQNTVIYARRELSIEGRIAAAKALIEAEKVGRGDQKNYCASTGNRPGSSTLSDSAISPSDLAPTAPRPQGLEQ